MTPAQLYALDSYQQETYGGPPPKRLPLLTLVRVKVQEKKA